MLRLHDHHAQLVASVQPWAQLAAVYEADAMLGSVVERVVGQAQRLLGDRVRPCLRSLDAIAHFDECSTLARTMVGFLDNNPERLDALAETAVRTLDIYGDFLIECHATASQLCNWPNRRHASG
jgi:hypothetical protein